VAQAGPPKIITTDVRKEKGPATNRRPKVFAKPDWDGGWGPEIVCTPFTKILPPQLQTCRTRPDHLRKHRYTRISLFLRVSLIGGRKKHTGDNGQLAVA
jgi:hypothetical protein